MRTDGEGVGLDRPGERVGNERMESGEFRAGTLHEALNTQESTKPFVFFLCVGLCASLCLVLWIFSKGRHFPFSLCPDVWPSQRAILRQAAGHGDAEEDGLQC